MSSELRAWCSMSSWHRVGRTANPLPESRTVVETHLTHPSSVSIRTHIGALACTTEKFRVDEGPEQALPRNRVVAQQPLTLRLGQAQPRNLDRLVPYGLEPSADVPVSR